MLYDIIYYDKIILGKKSRSSNTSTRKIIRRYSRQQWRWNVYQIDEASINRRWNGRE